MLVPAAVSLKKGRDIIELVAKSLPCFVQLVHIRKKITQAFYIFQQNLKYPFFMRELLISVKHLIG